jgi:hypothetical protein
VLVAPRSEPGPPLASLADQSLRVLYFGAGYPADGTAVMLLFAGCSAFKTLKCHNERVDILLFQVDDQVVPVTVMPAALADRLRASPTTSSR